MPGLLGSRSPDTKRGTSRTVTASGSDLPALGIAGVTVLAGFALYRFFSIALYPLYRAGVDAVSADFTVFYRAAELFRSGAPLYPDPGALNTYFYPPPLAVLLGPLVGLPHAPALFRLISLVALLASVLLLARLSDRPWIVGGMLTLLALAAWPTALLLRQGQLDSITLLLMVWSVVLMGGGRRRWAALALGFAIALKVSPVVLLLFWLWKRRYRLALETALAATGIVLVAGLASGVDNLRVYMTEVLPRIGSQGSAYWYNQSVHAALLRLVAETPYTQPVANLGLTVVVVLNTAISLALLAALLWNTPRAPASSRSMLLIEVAAFVSFEVLVVPLSWQMHAVWLLVPLAALLAILAEQREGGPWLPLAAGLAALAFVAGPYEPPFEYGRFANGWATLLIAHTTWGALALLLLCMQVRRRGRLAVLSTGSLATTPAEPVLATARPASPPVG